MDHYSCSRAIELNVTSNPAQPETWSRKLHDIIQHVYAKIMQCYSTSTSSESPKYPHILTKCGKYSASWEEMGLRQEAEIKGKWPLIPALNSSDPCPKGKSGW